LYFTLSLLHTHISTLFPYTTLFRSYGRITYQLMQFWQTLLKNPSGEKSMDDFAMAIDKIPKIVFSHELKNTEWESAKLANRTIEDRKSTRLNSSHVSISYAVFCLKK